MSLFKARDWWSTCCGADEEFDKGCLCVGNIDNSPDGSVKIIVGSYSGFLRIYKPQPEKLENGSYSGFRADELLLEAQLNSPILQVQTGLLVASTKLIHLAVLQPFKLSVYTITAVQGTVDHGTYYKLSLSYEHTLQRHSFCMILGPFGGIQDKDHICVQSLDGTLNFFEQESFAFSRYLPNSLLPGPIAYAKKTDSFVTVSGFSVESYRFQGLAVAKDENSEENVDKNFKAKKVAIDWSYDIGEGALDIIILNERNHISSLVIVLGERSLFALSPSGTLKFAKKFNFTPSCMIAHNEGIDGSPIILVATTNQTVLVFNEKQLKWAAQLPFCPVCMHIAAFMNVKGLLVLLSAQGSLACCYLGTEPSLYVTPMIEAKVIDFEEAEREMQLLKKIIKESNQNLLGTQHLGNEVSVTISMPHCIDSANNPEVEESVRSFGHTPTVTAKVHLKCSTVVHDVRLMIHVEPPLKALQNIYSFGSVVDYSLATVAVALDSDYIPSSLKFLVHVAYTSSQGTPRVYESSALIPFSLVAKACPPSKTAEYKITLDLNKKVIPSSELFSDLSPDNSSVIGGAMGIEYSGGQQISIMPSKSAQRYRLQSDSFPSLWLVVSELVRRLRYKYRKEDDSSKLSFKYSSPLPFHEYFSVIEEHFDIRQQIKEMETLLGQRAEQFRVVQKRLLTKMKDKTPTPLNNLDTLLEATHRHILSLTESLTKQAITLNSSCCSLSCATQLLLLLVKFSTNIKDDDYAFISACFSPVIDFDSHQGYEERLNVALTYLLKFCIGNAGKELGLPDISLELPKDLSKMKKHIIFLFDQIANDASINVTGSSNENNVMKTANGEMNRYEDELSIPVGSKFADTSDEKKEHEHVADEVDEPSMPHDSLYLPPEEANNEDAFSDYPDDGEEMII